MENSEKLAIALKNNTQTLTQLFEEAEIEIWGSDEEYALFLIDGNKFEFRTYITSNDSSWKNAFLSQNNAIFIDYIGEDKYQCLNFKDIIQDRIDELERLESEDLALIN
jgi:uncharacterized pyridoxamine 5'-phosphate oxidase family protein